MEREIVKYPNPILRKKAEEVREITEGIKTLALDMAETMTRNQGIGISAPQVGELKRIIVVQTEKGPEIFVNPKIIGKSQGKEITEEGCLSFPGLFLKIKRPKEIEMEAISFNGEKIQIKAQGLLARALEHEIDHLDGILFIDKLNFFQKLKLKLK